MSFFISLSLFPVALSYCCGSPPAPVFLSIYTFYTPFIKVSRAEFLFPRSCAIIWTLSFNFFGTMPLLSCIKKALVLSALSYLILRIRKGHLNGVLYILSKLRHHLLEKTLRHRRYLQVYLFLLPILA